MACGSCCVAHRLPPEWETHTQVSQAPQQSRWALPVQDGVRSTDPMARGSVWLSRELATAIPKVRAELGGPHCRQEASVSSPIPSHWGGGSPMSFQNHLTPQAYGWLGKGNSTVFEPLTIKSNMHKKQF